MNLADYQQEIVDQIYAALVNDDSNKGFTLFGSVGSGKSTIAEGIIAQLLEGWTIFYIEGISPDLSPYLTWHIGTKLHSTKKISFGGELSFGINFLPVPISLEFGLAPQALQIAPDRMRFCKKMDAYLVERMNQNKPKTFAKNYDA